MNRKQFRLPPMLHRLTHSEAAPGLILMAAAATALLAANSELGASG